MRYNENLLIYERGYTSYNIVRYTQIQLILLYTVHYVCEEIADISMLQAEFGIFIIILLLLYSALDFARIFPKLTYKMARGKKPGAMTFPPETRN